MKRVLSYWQNRILNWEKSTGHISISCSIKNRGAKAGAEVVQFYVSDRYAWVSRPNKELVGFKRIELDPGHSATVSMTIDIPMLAFHDHNMNFVIEPGTIGVMVGTSSEDLPLHGEFEITETRTEIPRERKMLSKVVVMKNNCRI